MSKYLQIAWVLVLAGGLVGLTAQAGWDPNKEETKKVDATDEVEETIVNFKESDPDLITFFEKAHGYAVFPTVGKAGMGLGGAYGKGFVYEKGKKIGKTTLKQVSIGFQFGGQSYSEIIFFKDEETLEGFKKGNYELGAQASAVAVNKGASRDADFSEGVAVFTLPKGGLMFDASVAGQKFTFEPI